MSSEQYTGSKDDIQDILDVIYEKDFPFALAIGMPNTCTIFAYTNCARRSDFRDMILALKQIYNTEYKHGRREETTEQGDSVS